MRWAGYATRMRCGEMHTGFWWEIPLERGRLEDLVVDGRIILNCIFNKLDEGMNWIDPAKYKNRWRAIVSGVMNFGFHKMRGISSMAEDASLSRTVLRGVRWFSWLVGWLLMEVEEYLLYTQKLHGVLPCRPRVQSTTWHLISLPKMVKRYRCRHVFQRCAVRISGHQLYWLNYSVVLFSPFTKATK